MPERPATAAARRRALRVRWAAAVLGVVLLGLWGTQPVDGAVARPDVVTGSRVGERVPLPGVPGAAIRVDAVTPVTWCSGRWWPGVGTLLSGPVTRVDLTMTGVDEATATRLAAGLTALDVRGRAYVGPTACACQDLCERGVRSVGDGWEHAVLLETGLTFAGLRVRTAAGGLRWDV